MRDVAEKLPLPGSQTVGYAVDEEGRPLHDLRLISGQTRWLGSVTEGLGRLPHDMAGHEVLKHVEGQVAALMRRSGSPQDAVVFINKDMCDGRLGYPGCPEVLPKVLPEGSTLTVYEVDPATPGTFKRRQVFRGTGEWL